MKTLTLRGFGRAAAILVPCTVLLAQGKPTPPSTTYVQPLPAEKHIRNLRQLTFGGSNAEAYFSHSGKQLIFQRKFDSAGAKSSCDQQFTMNIDGSALRRVSNGQGRTTCGYFFDNDRRILYSSTFGSGPSCPPEVDRSKGYVWPLSRMEIYTANPDGSGTKALTHTGGYNAETTLSPDGKRLIFTSDRDGDVELYTMNIDGSDVKRITHRVGYDGGAYYSQDGKSIVWRAGYPVTKADSTDYLSLFKENLVRPLKMELWVANADGSNPRQVTALGAASFAPYFTPDGKQIIFASNAKDSTGRKFSLLMVNVDGTGLEQLTFDQDFDSFPMFSPDGKKLVWASSRQGKGPGEINIFIADWVK